MGTSFLALLMTFFGSQSDLIDHYVPKEEQIFIKKVKEKVVDSKRPQDYGPSITPCEGDLIPLHEHQQFKEYHVEYVLRFGAPLPGNSRFCQVAQRRAPRGKVPRCLGFRLLYIKLLSDLYVDSCNQVIRGYALVDYTKPGEGMMDSVSPGHSLELVQRFSTGAQYRPGATSNVRQDRFLFFTLDTL